MKCRNSIKLAVAMALPSLGHLPPARAQTIQIAHESAVLSDCQDLMNKIRQQYGRAPICMKVTDPGGQSLTNLSGLVGLSDDMTNFWYEMRITTNIADPTSYRYSESDLDNVVAMIQYSHRGLTVEQVNQKVTGNACAETISRIKAAHATGALSESQYQLALKDAQRTIKGCSQ